MGRRADIHSFKNGMYIRQWSRKDVEGQKENFAEETLGLYHILSSSWSAKQYRIPQTK